MKKWDQHIDGEIKHRIEQVELPFQEKGWAMMEQKLKADKQQRKEVARHRLYVALGASFLLALCLTGVLYYEFNTHGTQNDKKLLTHTLSTIDEVNKKPIDELTGSKNEPIITSSFPQTTISENSAVVLSNETISENQINQSQQSVNSLYSQSMQRSNYIHLDHVSAQNSESVLVHSKKDLNVSIEGINVADHKPGSEITPPGDIQNLEFKSSSSINQLALYSVPEINQENHTIRAEEHEGQKYDSDSPGTAAPDKKDEETSEVKNAEKHKPGKEARKQMRKEQKNEPKKKHNDKPEQLSGFTLKPAFIGARIGVNEHFQYHPNSELYKRDFRLVDRLNFDIHAQYLLHTKWRLEMAVQYTHQYVLGIEEYLEYERGGYDQGYITHTNVIDYVRELGLSCNIIFSPQENIGFFSAGLNAGILSYSKIRGKDLAVLSYDPVFDDEPNSSASLRKYNYGFNIGYEYPVQDWLLIGVKWYKGLQNIVGISSGRVDADLSRLQLSLNFQFRLKNTKYQ